MLIGDPCMPLSSSCLSHYFYFFFFNLYSEKSKLVSDCLFNMGFASLVH